MLAAQESKPFPLKLCASLVSLEDMIRLKASEKLSAGSSYGVFRCGVEMAVKMVGWAVKDCCG